MAEKESEKKLLAILVILIAASLVVDLISLNVLYVIEDSGALEGELSAVSPLGITPTKKDKCVTYCTTDCMTYWGIWYSTCVANCQARYDSGELNTKQLRACKNSCSSIKYSDSECVVACAGYSGGDPTTGVCCYQDWIINPDGSFECVYYF